MAVGSYMKGFQWSRPRQGQGGFFPEELPSDSEILLALFTAYLVTPGWNWRLMGERPPDSRWALHFHNGPSDLLRLNCIEVFH